MGALLVSFIEVRLEPNEEWRKILNGGDYLSDIDQLSGIFEVIPSRDMPLFPYSLPYREEVKPVDSKYFNEWMEQDLGFGPFYVATGHDLASAELDDLATKQPINLVFRGIEPGEFDPDDQAVVNLYELESDKTLRAKALSGEVFQHEGYFYQHRPIRRRDMLMHYGCFVFENIKLASKYFGEDNVRFIAFIVV